MKMKLVPLVVLSVLLIGCSRVEPIIPSLPGELIDGLANVKDVEVVMLMSFPLQVHLRVSGYLGDPCTQIDEVEVEWEGYHFDVSISTRRESELACIQVIEPFEENIPLDVYGLSAGDYTVDVNGIETTFTLFQDNVLEP